MEYGMDNQLASVNVNVTCDWKFLYKKELKVFLSGDQSLVANCQRRRGNVPSFSIVRWRGEPPYIERMHGG